MLTLEQLISRYEDAVFDPLFDPDTCALLCQQVEREADRVGYTNHGRLMALHTMYERAELAHEAAQGRH